MEYLDLWNAARKLSEDDEVQHVYIAVMREDGSFRSFRGSELGAGGVKSLIDQVKDDPSHHIESNLQEVTTTGSNQGMKPDSESQEAPRVAKDVL